MGGGIGIRSRGPGRGGGWAGDRDRDGEASYSIHPSAKPVVPVGMGGVEGSPESRPPFFDPPETKFGCLVRNVGGACGEGVRDRWGSVG